MLNFCVSILIATFLLSSVSLAGYQSGFCRSRACFFCARVMLYLQSVDFLLQMKDPAVVQRKAQVLWKPLVVLYVWVTGECSGLKSIENSSPKSVLDWIMCLKEIVWGVNLILMGRNSVWSLSEMFGGVRPRFGPVLWLQVVNKTNTPMFKVVVVFC